MCSWNWCAPKRPGAARLHGESSSLTSKIASGLIFFEIGDVEHPQAAVRPAAAPRHFLGAVRVVFLVDRDARCCRPSIGAGTAMKVCEGSGNGGW